MLRRKDLLDLGEQLSIDKVGVSRVEQIGEEKLNTWLNRGFQGEMSYMERNMDKRLDPENLFPEARSVISIFMNYHQKEFQPHLEGVISKYARSVDYHVTVKNALHDLARTLFRERVDGMSRKERAKIYRVFVDSAPVMEKYWAIQAGIGWMGKHTNIINKELGSWGFLGEIITTEQFDEYDSPVTDHCGTCTACIDACPTAAIVEPYVLDGSQCISYATIELDAGEAIPEMIRVNMDEWLFGCDICQDVCPWNREAPAAISDLFQPVPEFSNGEELPNFVNIDELTFQERFGATPLSRAGLYGMRRNQISRD